MTGPKPIRTEFGTHHRLESCGLHSCNGGWFFERLFGGWLSHLTTKGRVFGTPPWVFFAKPWVFLKIVPFCTFLWKIGNVWFCCADAGEINWCFPLLRLSSYLIFVYKRVPRGRQSTSRRVGSSTAHVGSIRGKIWTGQCRAESQVWGLETASPVFLPNRPVNRTYWCQSI